MGVVDYYRDLKKDGKIVIYSSIAILSIIILLIIIAIFSAHIAWIFMSCLILTTAFSAGLIGFHNSLYKDFKKTRKIKKTS